MQVRKLNYTIPQEIKSELKMAWEYIKGNVSSAVELRVSFIMQVAGMMLNNTSLLIIWIFFFNAFGNINGWSGKEVIALQGFVAMSYGITFSLFSGASELPIAINNGSFDNILLTPRNLYLRILTIVTRASALGDTLYGLILLIIYSIIAGLSIAQFSLFIMLLIPATLIITNFLLVTSCIGFFIPDSEELSKNTFELMFGPSLYPSGVYQGAMRIFFLFVIPAIAISGLPVETIQNFSFTNVLIVWSLAGLWSLVTYYVLKQGIKKYESGNLTGARI